MMIVDSPCGSAALGPRGRRRRKARARSGGRWTEHAGRTSDGPGSRETAGARLQRASCRRSNATLRRLAYPRRDSGRLGADLAVHAAIVTAGETSADDPDMDEATVRELWLVRLRADPIQAAARRLGRYGLVLS